MSRNFYTVLLSFNFTTVGRPASLPSLCRQSVEQPPCTPDKGTVAHDFPAKKGKGCHIPLQGCRRGAHLPSLGREPVGGWTTKVCDAWPVRRQTYGYLPSRRASPPLGRYQIILLGDRGTWVSTTCPELLPGDAPAGS